MIFPVPFIPKQDYRGGRGFGADRSKVALLLKIPGEKLKHGADLRYWGLRQGCRRVLISKRSGLCLSPMLNPCVQSRYR